MSIAVTASQVLPSLGYAYEKLIEKDYGLVFWLPEHRCLVCELTKGYVPIEEFREIFLETVPIIEKHQIRKFVFDKQNLRVFHQPSMEWYFVEWKTRIFELGLSVHRKILPQNEPSFALAVEAGRAKIAAEYPQTIIAKLDIQYKNTVDEAIRS